MEQKKKFEPFEKVIIKRKNESCGVVRLWTCAEFSHYNGNFISLAGGYEYDLDMFDVLPFEGNAHLVGTSDMPDEEVKLIYGNLIFASSDENRPPQNWTYTQYHGIGDCRIKGKGACVYLFCVPFEKFNPNDMKETRKHILTAINGKLVKAIREE